MGDTVELTTNSKNAISIYRVSTCSMSIDIKAIGNAAIGLSSEPSQGCNFWIVVGDHNETSFIKQAGGENKVIQTPNLLFENQYRRFWIRWSQNKLSFGSYGLTGAQEYMTFETQRLSVSFFTLCSYGSRNTVYWRFKMAPPKPITPPLVHLRCLGPSWLEQRVDAPLPPNAVIGGRHDRGYLYIIRAPHMGSLTPGKFAPGSKHGYISWGMTDHKKDVFEILTGVNCVWVAAARGRVPGGAVVGGHSEVHREPLYVGRAVVDGHILPGKVQQSHSCCYVASGGREVACSEYEVLVNPDMITNGMKYNDADWNDAEWMGAQTPPGQTCLSIVWRNSGLLNCNIP